jgi:N-acetylneuraminic acid mutarotase
MAWYTPIPQNDPPSCRAAHSCDKVANNLYIFGGWNGKKALNDLYVLDLDNLVCRSEPETYGQKPACRNNHTTAVYVDKIYFHGGHDGNQWLDDLHLLNTMSLVWSKPKVSGQKPSARACHTMSRVGRKLYMFGGYDGDKCFNDIDILDLDTMTWIQPQVQGVIPMARNAHTMTVLGNKLYLFGGHSGNKHLKDLHVFDTETLTWTEPSIFGSPPKGLRGHTANLIGNKIYLFGGYDGRGKSFKKIIPSNDLYVLNTDTMRWSHPVESEKAPAGRQRHTACVIGMK